MQSPSRNAGRIGNIPKPHSEHLIVSRSLSQCPRATGATSAAGSSSVFRVIALTSSEYTSHPRHIPAGWSSNIFSTVSRSMYSAIAYLAFSRHLPVTGDSDVQNTVPVTGVETATAAIGFLSAVSAQPLKSPFYTVFHVALPLTPAMRPGTPRHQPGQRWSLR